MKRNIASVTIAAFALLALPLTAVAGLTPGLYEYTVKMNMPGMPANAQGMPPQIVQRCVTAKDIASKGYGAPRADSDCQIQDMKENGGQFSYKIACTKPQKMDGTVKGSLTATTMTMDTTMAMGGHGTMTQSTTAKRIGDCKQQ
jgi:hypothetical protein